MSIYYYVPGQSTGDKARTRHGFHLARVSDPVSSEQVISIQRVTGEDQGSSSAACSRQASRSVMLKLRLKEKSV